MKEVNLDNLDNLEKSELIEIIKEQKATLDAEVKYWQDHRIKRKMEVRGWGRDHPHLIDFIVRIRRIRDIAKLRESGSSDAAIDSDRKALEAADERFAEIRRERALKDAPVISSNELE